MSDPCMENLVVMSKNGDRDQINIFVIRMIKNIQIISPQIYFVIINAIPNISIGDFQVNYDMIPHAKNGDHYFWGKTKNELFYVAKDSLLARDGYCFQILHGIFYSCKDEFSDCIKILKNNEYSDVIEQGCQELIKHVE